MYAHQNRHYILLIWANSSRSVSRDRALGKKSKISDPLRLGNGFIESYRNRHSLPLTLSEPIDLAWGHISPILDFRDLRIDLDCETKIIAVRHSSISIVITSFITIPFFSIVYSFHVRKKWTLHFADLAKYPEFSVTCPSSWNEIENYGSVTPLGRSQGLIIFKPSLASVDYVGAIIGNFRILVTLTLTAGKIYRRALLIALYSHTKLHQD